MNPEPGTDGSIVGRDAELASLRRLSRGEGGARGIVLVGGPGIGKTTLWEAGIADAHCQGAQVLVARPVKGEARLPSAGLIDLCEHLGPAEFEALPAPQRRGLEAALLRAEPIDGVVHAGAVEVGFLGIVRALAVRGPLVIAVDDVQWLDRASAGVLAFAARRVRSAAVAFLLARLPGRATELERAIERAALETVKLSALGADAVRRMLWHRLGLRLSRPSLQRVLDVTQGNPLFALEIGRSLPEHDGPVDVRDIPVPASLEEIVSDRIAELAPEVRTVLLATMLSPELRLATVRTIAGEDAVDDALHEGVVALDGERVTAAHPLLAAVARKRSSARERRELHRALAGVTDERPLRAWHLALASRAWTRSSPRTSSPARGRLRRGAGASRPSSWLGTRCG